MSYRLLHLVPKNYLSFILGRLAAIRLPAPLARFSVRLFARLAKIDPSTASKAIEEYASISDFFTRDLKPGLRPIATGLVSPVDGTLREYGSIGGDLLPQVKGRWYSLLSLLGDQQLAEQFNGGSFYCLYLSPRDYHHIHAPLSGNVVQNIYIPGFLWPVNDWALSNIEGLFAVNERVISVLETPQGKIAVAMVAATNVGAITVTYDSSIRTNANPGREVGPAYIQKKEYPNGIPVNAGDRLGTFHLGSTVILICQKGVAQPEGAFPRAVKFGQQLASLEGDATQKT